MGEFGYCVQDSLRSGGGRVLKKRGQVEESSISHCLKWQVAVQVAGYVQVRLGCQAELATVNGRDSGTQTRWPRRWLGEDRDMKFGELLDM